MRRSLAAVAALLFGLALIVGCGDDKTKTKTGAGIDPNRPTPVAFFEVCEKCGEVENSVNCCKDLGEEKNCAKCKKHKDSPGCCQESHHLHVCKKCGARFDGDAKDPHVCQAITEACAKCGCQKGSPGCCVEMKPEKTGG